MQKKYTCLSAFKGCVTLFISPSYTNVGFSVDETLTPLNSTNSYLNDDISSISNAYSILIVGGVVLVSFVIGVVVIKRKKMRTKGFGSLQLESTTKV